MKKREKKFMANARTENIFSLDGTVPLSKAIPFGIQHVLSMFVANIAPLLIVFSALSGQEGYSTEFVSNGIRSAIFFAAVGTTIQLFPIWKVGSKMPIVVGLSFTFVGVLSTVGIQYGISTMFVSIIIGGLVIGILGLFAKYWRKFIKPIVAAVVVLGIGLSLLEVGAQEFINYDSSTLTADGLYDFANQWPHLVIAFSALISSLLFQMFVPGIWKNINVLVGLVVGYIVALCFGVVDFSGIQFNTLTDFIDVPRPIFTIIEFSWSSFNIGAIIVVIIIYLVASTEGIGDLSSLANAGLGRDPTDEEISGGLACDGFVSALAGCFGALPLTTFSQNVGIVSQTKVVNRFTIFMGVILLYVASFFPVVSSVLMTIPDSVLGGCMISLFASIVVVGMQMLSKCGFSKKNITIVSLSIGLGYGITLIPEFTSTSASYPEFVNYIMLIIDNPVANMFILSLILSYVLPEKMNNEPKPQEVKVEEEPPVEVPVDAVPPVEEPMQMMA